jgi:lathosterol oxidase
MNEFLQYILDDSTYLEVYVLTFLYFCLLYFFLAPIFLVVCKLLEKQNIVERIVHSEITKKQMLSELKNSSKSIVLFGFSGVVMIYLYREHVVVFKEFSVLNTLIGVLYLTLWNEIHFFLVHRLMHIPYLYRNIHRVHHQSKITTVYSVYSFHWFEAMLLSTVPITIAPFIDFSTTAIFLYPVASILLNYAGHCNYRFGKGNGVFWKQIGTRHAQHHLKNSKNFGFALTTFDWLFASNKKK